MILESPHLPSPVPATHESIAALIPRLVGADDPFAIVSSAGDQMTYAQVLWMPGGFILDYQAGRIDRHFRTVRQDLTVEEIIAALNTYAAGGPVWSLGLEFEPIELRSIWQRMGYPIGYAIGSVKRFFRRLSG